MNRLSLAVSRAWFLADVLAGRAGGSRCPNCDSRPAAEFRERSGTLHAFTVWRCPACHLLFRPAGLSAGGFARFYYSHLYDNADLVTDIAALDDLERLPEKMGRRRRARLIRELTTVPEGRPVVYVLGCTWGYEVWDLNNDGFHAVGIEISAPRRELGAKRLGVHLYASVEEARAREPRPDIVLSSHVLEHVGRLESYLDHVRGTAQAALHIHITPHVDCYSSDAAAHRLVGREHPIGVTTRFWQQFADRRAIVLTTRVDGYRPNEWAGELVAVLDERTRATNAFTTSSTYS